VVESSVKCCGVCGEKIVGTHVVVCVGNFEAKHYCSTCAGTLQDVPSETQAARLQRAVIVRAADARRDDEARWTDTLRELLAAR